MKWILSLATLMTVIGAQAAVQTTDKKLGNVVAIEREMSGVFQACIDQVKDPESSRYIFCSFPAPVNNNKSEFTVGMNKFLFVEDTTCSVEGLLQNNRVVFSFMSKNAKPDFAAAKACLQKALGTGDSVKFTMYTIE